MRAGFRDYENGVLENWTINNPKRDYLPVDLVKTLNKSFYFVPGKGGAYSSDGFVVAGMVLAAITGARTWSDFDQLAAIGDMQPPLNGTIFMKTGACSQYPLVVHQYARKPTSRGWGPDTALEALPASQSQGRCDASDQPGILVSGGVFGKIHSVRNASECCMIAQHHAKEHHKDIPFSFLPDAKNVSNSTCTTFSSVTGYRPVPNATSGGFSNGPGHRALNASDFVDLYNTSCLNGWTMGNIAVTPSDVTRFFLLLAQGEVVSESWLAEMKRFRNLTDGFVAGFATYGLGLMSFPSMNSARDVTGASVNWTVNWGHPGE
jgi:hypothetical protein